MTAKKAIDVISVHWFKAVMVLVFVRAIMWGQWLTEETYGHSQDIALIQQEIVGISAHIVASDAQSREFHEKMIDKVTEVIVGVARLEAALERQ